MEIQNRLKFNVSDDGRYAQWHLPGTALASTTQGDFWRLMADDFYHKEMTVRSSKQTGTVTHVGNVTSITYDGLYTDSGKYIDAVLTLTVTRIADRMLFGSTIENRDTTRLNELQYPYIDLSSLVGSAEKDVLYRPYGLGERIENPWEALKKDHTEYMSADYHEIKSTLLYPRPASMAWIGIQSGEYFLYMGKQDARTHPCCLLNAVASREATVPRLVSSICQYPCVRGGETVSPSDVAVSMFLGDWRGGSDLYGTFARQTYFKPISPKPWVQAMTGWQRVILRHQYGEILYYYRDLPELYRKGKKYGLDTLLVFGWWKGRFDNGYPHYEVDDELGGEQGLKDAIAEVQRLGGHVILYNNGILIDKNTDFYRKHHEQAAKIDIDGNEYVMNYRFENDGTILRNYGYKTFYEACQATEEWYNVMENNARLKLSFSPDSIFFDQVGGVVRLCFNEKHKHGPRPDDELHFRRENIRRLRKLLGPDQAIGTECTNDAVSGEHDYIHGCDKGNYCRKSEGKSMSSLFPQLFRRTFPEIIMTNRFTHDCRNGWKKELNYAFVHGFRFDVAIYRSRGDIEMLPEYAALIGKLLALKRSYARYFYDSDSRYVCDTVLSVPSGIRYAEYKRGNEKLFVFSNENEEDVTLCVDGVCVTVPAMSVACAER